MGLNDGGYTFLDPRDLPTLTNDEIQAMHTDKTSFIERILLKDGTQQYGVVKQVKENR